MKLNMIALSIVSVIQLILILWHMFKYRGRAIAISFIVFGFLFGIIRSNIINFIQISTNNSLLPYQFRDSLLKIGNDSLQVYVGWIIAAYYAWCFAEMILNKQTFISKINNNKKSLFAVLSVSFLFIASFCYMVETTASYAGWWSWNESLSAGFASSLFVNVPWVGIVDWATVAFEYLGVFLLSWYVIKTKKYIYLLILLFPIFHWVSHINFGNFYWSIFGFSVTVSVLVHLLIPVFAMIAIFIASPNLIEDKKISYKSVWVALIIGAIFCFIFDVFVGKAVISLFSLIPILILMSLVKGVKIKKLFYISVSVFIFDLIFVSDTLDKKRLIMAFFPLAYFAIIYLVRLSPKIINKLNRLYKIIIITVLIILIAIIGILTFNSGVLANTAKTNGQISKNRKFVLLITMDTLRNDHTGIGGYKLGTTPNLDKISKDGVYFSDAYSAIPYTYPSHLALFTGMYPGKSGINHNSSSEDKFYPTLAELFKNKGYATSAFVSSSILERNGTTLGFDNFNFKQDVTSSADPERRSDSTTKKANEWLDKNYKEPFFLWVHYYDAHQPYDSYCGKSYSIGKKPDTPLFKDGSADEIGPIPTTKDYEYLMSLYDEEIQCQDRQLGLLMDKLKSLGIYKDTNIIITSDHGENFDHGTLYHGDNLYESAIRVPLIIKMDNISGVYDLPVSLVDIAPTLVDRFNLMDNIKFDGLDLFSRDITNRKDLFSETLTDFKYEEQTRKTAILENNSKLIVSLKNNNTTNFEAYNIENDKAELNNLWGKDNLFNNLLPKLNSYSFNE